ncbi:MAG: response regulator transcription factor [Lachnospiraceae bacterium]|nr:response regulator transcription factor [Lachnospiraceae bacterium]MBP5184354.1 response regulator transcription factor [Lachnospiraceae bacterium]
MKALILEDNKESLRALAELLRQISDEVEVYTADSVEKAMVPSEEETIDLFLLDINLNIRDDDDTSGLDFAKSLREQTKYAFTPIVFITSYPAFELNSYRQTGCYSFITKPFRKSEVEKIVRKLLNSGNAAENDEKYITVKKDGINYRLKQADIVYIQAISRGVCINLRKESMDIKYLTIKESLDLLKESPEFVQCHRNAIVNLHYVESFDSVNRMLQLTGRTEPVEVGVTYKQAIKDILKQ